MIQSRVTDLHNPSYGRPPKRKKAKKKAHRPRGSRSNPGPFVLTLGALGANPKRRKTVAKKRKKKSTRAPAKANRSKKRSYKNKKRNPGVSMALIRRVMKGKKKKGHRKSSRNPSFMGMRGGEVFANSAAVLGAVTIAKLIPPMLPASWTATDLGRFLTTAGVAAGEVMAAHFLIPRYRVMVLAGAGAQTLSVALNPVLRKVSSNITLGRIRQRSLGATGDFVPGSFPEPHNPIYNRMIAAGMAVTPGAVGPSASVGRYRGRFGGR